MITCHGHGPAVIGVGERAPDFSLPDQDGETVRLSYLRGRIAVLYFYPQADTPGCTVQSCGVRDHRAAYEQRNAVVVGISPDPVTEVARFHREQRLNFTLLADADHAVCSRYGVWHRSRRLGILPASGARRVTFIVDPEGVVADVLDDVDPATHDTRVIEALDALSGSRAESATGPA